MKKKKMVKITFYHIKVLIFIFKIEKFVKGNLVFIKRLVWSDLFGFHAFESDFNSENVLLIVRQYNDDDDDNDNSNNSFGYISEPFSVFNAFPNSNQYESVIFASHLIIPKK